MAEKKKSTIEIVNRKATHDFLFQATLEAGILLTGTEIKSVRKGNANLRDAYCTFKKGELFVNSMFIGEYKFGNIHNHEPRRLRKLLLKKAELRKWEKRVKEKGFTIVPYKIYISERGLAKVEIALAQGKKSFDKRDSIKEKDNKRDMDRLNKIKL
ncbi:MAG: SsrA-binding protein SmpB [Saprospiraceae bacterium]|nr:SsrA-binding protein SmpB [Saprospiraceae bacterium]MCB9326505.1 SsrA-binding protein SmpB [Lewinellaceae bacterium]